VDLKAQLSQSKREGLDLMAQFVLTELEVGRTFCALAHSYESAERRKHAIKNAWTALESAEKYMFKLQMEHSVFDEMTAQMERLKFELESFSESGK
jgi:hypothetical protein